MGPFVQYYLSLIVWLSGLVALAVIGPGGPRAAVFLLAGVTAVALVFNLFGVSCAICGARVGLWLDELTPKLPGPNCRRCGHDLVRRLPD